MPSDESLNMVRAMRQAVVPLDEMIRRTLRVLGPAARRTGVPRRITHESLATITDAPALLSWACYFAGGMRDSALRVGVRLGEPWIHRHAGDWPALASEADGRGVQLGTTPALATLYDRTGDRVAVDVLVAFSTHHLDLMQRLHALRQRGGPVLAVWRDVCHGGAPREDLARPAGLPVPLVITRCLPRPREDPGDSIADLAQDLVAAEWRAADGMILPPEVVASCPLRDR